MPVGCGEGGGRRRKGASWARRTAFERWRARARAWAPPWSWAGCCRPCSARSATLAPRSSVPTWAEAGTSACATCPRGSAPTRARSSSGTAPRRRTAPGAGCTRSPWASRTCGRPPTTARASPVMCSRVARTPRAGSSLSTATTTTGAPASPMRGATLRLASTCSLLTCAPTGRAGATGSGAAGSTGATSWPGPAGSWAGRGRARA